MGAIVLGVVAGVVVLVAGSTLWQRRVDRIRRVREFRHDASRLVVAVESLGPGIVGTSGALRDETWAANVIQAGVLIDRLSGAAKELPEDKRTLVTGVLEDLHARWTAAVPDVMHHGAAMAEGAFAMICADASRLAEAFGATGGAGPSP
ncbi:MAG: hypothetical protein KGJ77_03445 [Acidobacteriota bacterium]|nr:hypothetical protein [Acidobacteriota bacterium]